MEIDRYGNQRWYNADRELHRDNDLPAIEYADGGKEWWVNGMMHRGEDLPAAEYENGTNKFWWVNGKRHRDNDLPAIEYVDRIKLWYNYGNCHRLGGLPAIEYIRGNNNSWYIYGRYFRYKQIINSYKILKNFGRHCLKKIRMRKLRRVRWIHGELLCMPPKRSYPGGQDYHQMVNYFMSM
jgi:hypothetical protein